MQIESLQNIDFPKTKAKDRTWLQKTLVTSAPSIEARVPRQRPQRGASGRLHRNPDGDWVWSSDSDDADSDDDDEQNQGQAVASKSAGTGASSSEDGPATSSGAAAKKIEEVSSGFSFTLFLHFDF